MSPDVVRKKLSALTMYLQDLRHYEGITFDEFMKRHYEIERILELLVMTASDIVLHLISAAREPVASSYRAAFLRAGELGMLSKGLSENLSRSAGLRNILVHEYEEIDYRILHASIPSALRDFTAMISELSGK